MSRPISATSRAAAGNRRHVGPGEFHFPTDLHPLGWSQPQEVPPGPDPGSNEAEPGDLSSVLDAAFDAGLSGPGRLHDLFTVSLEAVTPGKVQAARPGIVIRWGWHERLFGTCLAMATDRGRAGSLSDDRARTRALPIVASRFPQAQLAEDPMVTATLSRRSSKRPAKKARLDAPLRLFVRHAVSGSGLARCCRSRRDADYYGSIARALGGENCRPCRRDRAAPDPIS